MEPDLDDLRVQFEAVQSDAAELTAGLNDRQFNWRTAPGQWSISECLTHLNVVDGLDLGPLSSAVERARADGWTGRGPFRYGALSKWFIGKMEPPVKTRMKAPKIYVPPPEQSKEMVVAEFKRIHGRLLEILALADGLDLARIKVPTPIAKWIRFSFTQRMRLLAAHDRRHLWQARQVRKHADFPGG